MLSIQDNQINFDQKHCCQCGVCLAACPKQALMSEECKDGFFNIYCDSSKCVVCSICVHVCPAHHLPEVFDSAEQVKNAKGLFLGHAVDDNVRFMASSGGIARTLICEMLRTKQVDAIYSLIYPSDDSSAKPANINEEHPMVCPTGREVEGQWMTESPTMEHVPCSIYRPVLWGKRLQEIDHKWRKVMLIGLPCQLKAAKALLSKIAPKLHMTNVAIFCRQQKTATFTRYIKQILQKSDVPDEWIFYRGQGWPGLTGIAERTEPLPIVKTKNMQH